MELVAGHDSESASEGETCAEDAEDAAALAQPLGRRDVASGLGDTKTLLGRLEALGSTFLTARV